MGDIKTVLQAFLLLSVQPAFALEATTPITLPPVPVAGVPPVLEYALSLLSVILTITLPIAVAFLKQRLDVANTTNHNEMIDRAIRRGGLVAYGNQLSGASPGQAAADGLAYVKNAVPESIGKVDQATDSHLANAIAAEVVGLNTAPVAPTAPSLIIPLKGP